MELNFHMNIPGNKLAKMYANWFSHTTKMADIPVYGKKKPFKNLLQNQKADDLGTWTYLCFISFLYLDLYVLGDDAFIS